MSPKLLLMLPTTGQAQHRRKVCSEKRCRVPLTAPSSSSCMQQDKAPTSRIKSHERKQRLLSQGGSCEPYSHHGASAQPPLLGLIPPRAEIGKRKGDLAALLGPKVLAKPLEILRGAGEGSSQGLAAARAEVTGQAPTGCRSIAQKDRGEQIG